MILTYFFLLAAVPSRGYSAFLYKQNVSRHPITGCRYLSEFVFAVKNLKTVKNKIGIVNHFTLAVFDYIG